MLTNKGMARIVKLSSFMVPYVQVLSLYDTMAPGVLDRTEIARELRS